IDGWARATVDRVNCKLGAFGFMAVDSYINWFWSCKAQANYGDGFYLIGNENHLYACAAASCGRFAVVFAGDTNYFLGDASINGSGSFGGGFYYHSGDGNIVARGSY